LNDFMKFLNDFTIFNDLDTHLLKLQWCCEKCQRVNDKFQLGEMYLNGIIGDDSRDYPLQKGKLSNLKKQQMK
jgi:hypothetical protein